ncbi:MAG: hypothetical protein ACJ790_00815 [Myxococcaceae bacterium]
MGYSFRFKMPNASWRELLARIQKQLPADLRVSVEKPELGSKNKAPSALIIFRDRLSTRGVELLESEDRLTLRIPAFPSREDVTLGLHVAQLAAEELGGEVETIDGVLAAKDLFADKIAEPIGRAQSGDLAALNAAVTKGETQQFMGAVRPFFIGPRLYEELRSNTAQEGMMERVVRAFHTTQWIHLKGFQSATILGLRKGATDFTASAWSPGPGHLFAPVDIVLVKAPGQPLRLPWAGLQPAAQERFRFLDEKQVLVLPITEAEWPEIISRAEALLGVKN